MQPHRAIQRKGNFIGDMHTAASDRLCAFLANGHYLAPDDDRDSGVGVNRPQLLKIVESYLDCWHG